VAKNKFQFSNHSN